MVKVNKYNKALIKKKIMSEVHRAQSVEINEKSGKNTLELERILECSLEHFRVFFRTQRIRSIMETIRIR